MNTAEIAHLTLYQIPVSLKDAAALDGFLVSHAKADLNAVDQVHLWIGQANPDRLFTDYLDADEKIRAQKLKMVKQRHWFSYSRSLLRLILSRYTNIPPQEIRLEYGINGKPSLVPQQNEKNICLNVSHSNGYFACAVGYRDIGIDIEHVIPNPKQVRNISKSFYSPAEAALIEAKEEPEKYFLFYKYWTIKEAFIKSAGHSIMQIKEIPCLCPLPADATALVTPFSLPDKSGFTARIAGHTYLAAIWCNNKYQGL